MKVTTSVVKVAKASSQLLASAISFLAIASWAGQLRQLLQTGAWPSFSVIDALQLAGIDTDAWVSFSTPAWGMALYLVFENTNFGLTGLMLGIMLGLNPVRDWRSRPASLSD